jgi:hypothetical protein
MMELQQLLHGMAKQLDGSGLILKLLFAWFKQK